MSECKNGCSKITEIAPGFARDEKGVWFFSAAALRRELVAIGLDERAKQINLLQGDGPSYLIGRLVESGLSLKRSHHTIRPAAVIPNGGCSRCSYYGRLYVYDFISSQVAVCGTCEAKLLKSLQEQQQAEQEELDTVSTVEQMRADNPVR